MISRKLSVLTVASLLASTLVATLGQPAQALDCAVASGFSAGDGSSSATAYEIDTVGELQYLATMASADTNGTTGKFFKVTAEIDAEGCYFAPIGSAISGKQFKGSFDGGGFAIRNLTPVRAATITPPISMASLENQDVGLFGVTDEADIKNVVLMFVNSIGTERVGALVGSANNTSFEKIQIDGAYVTGSQYVGSIAGQATYTSSYPGNQNFREIFANNVNVRGKDKVGGLVGVLTGSSNPTMLFVGGSTNITLYDSPSGVTGTYAGGLFGSFINNSSTSSLSLASFSGGLFAIDAAGDLPILGGLVGTTQFSSMPLNIIDSYSMGYLEGGPEGIYSGIIGDGGNGDSLEHVYASMTYMVRSPAVGFVDAYPLVKNPNLFVKESFVDNSNHNSWHQSILDVSADIFRDYAAMRIPETFTSQAWIVETSADVIRSKVSPKPWYLHPSMNSGMPGHLWVYNASLWQQPCGLGNYSVDGIVPCTDAEPGYFVGVFQATEQTPCPTGLYSSQYGSPLCQLAAKGHYVDSTAATMDVPCRVGTYQDEFGKDDCKIPGAGFYAAGPGAEELTACAAGTYKPAPSTDDCTEAAAGRFVGTTAATMDVPCRLGTFQPATGQASCIDAHPGHFVWQTGQQNQSACTPGFYQPNAGSTDCMPAGEGHYVPNTADVERQVCNPGTYQPGLSATSCIEATAGHYVPSPGLSEQSPCLAGTFQEATGQDGCDPAPQGFFVGSDAAVFALPCLPGTYQPNTGSSECLNSGRGYVAPGTGDVERVECPAGTYQPLIRGTACLDAPRGRFVAMSGSADATLCPVGTYQPDTGKMFCLLARSGYFVAETGAVTDQPCPEGMTSSAGATECLPPGSGGGGGGGGFFPPVEDTAPAISTNPASGGGSAVVDEEGRAVDATVGSNDQGRTLEISVGDTKLSLGSSSGGLATDKPSSLTKGAKLNLSLAGFSPGTKAVVYLLPESIFVAASAEPFADITIDNVGNAVLNLNLDVAPGNYALQVSGLAANQSKLSFVINIQVVGDTALAVWTKRLPGNSEAKLYAKSIVGAGKVSFRLNGKEIAWIRAVDESDPKLRVVTSGPMAGANYLVRTVKLKSGKNILEIFLNGERLRRTSYSK